MSFISVFRTLGFKIETSPYTAETLAAGDYNVPAVEISYDPSIAMLARKLARGDMSKDVSIAGKRSGNITFKIHLAWQGSATVAPSYFKCLQACGLLQTTPASNVVLTTNAACSKVPATIEIVEKDEGASPTQVVVKFRGCMGNAKFEVGNVGEPVAVTFEFQGVLVSITDRAFGSILTPTGFDTALPDAVLSASVKVFGEVQTCNKITIDLGNKIELFSDPAAAEGIQGAHVVDRNPTMDADPDLDTIANRGDYARLTGNTTGAFQMTVGSHLTFSAPAAQLITAYKPTDREGHVVNSKHFELKRSAGNDELVLTQA